MLWIAQTEIPSASDLSKSLHLPRILLVDDHDVVRQGVRRILETQNDWEIAGEAANGQEAVRLYRQLKPDAVVAVTTALHGAS